MAPGLVVLLACAIAAAQALAQAPPPGPAPYQREGATVKLSERVYVIPDFKVGMVPNVGNFAKRSPEIAALLKDVTFRKPVQVFEREMTLDLGGVRVRIMRLGPGHTRGDTVMFVEEDRVLFAGDLTMKGLFPALASPQSRSDTWLVALDEMERLKPRIVVGAHYDVGDASDIEAYRGYLKALRARAAELKRDGQSADEAGKILVDEFTTKYPGWAQPARVAAGVAAVYRASLALFRP